MRLLLRCDGGRATGIGHVMRSLALAEEAVARGHTVSLLGRVEGCLLEVLAHDLGHGFTLLGPEGVGHRLADVALAHDAVHVDHYLLGTEVLDDVDAAARSAGVRRPLVSTMADGKFGARPADVMVDPMGGAECGGPLAAARWHLRGGRFTPLRRAVTHLAPEEAPTAAGAPGALRVVVVIGGGDPVKCGPSLVDALDKVGPLLDVTVVSSPDTEGVLAEAALTWSRGRLRVTPPLPDLPAIMASADVVVTAAGTTTWEVCALQRAMALVAVVDNQRAGHDRVVAAGAGVGLGTADDVRDPQRTADRLRPLFTDAALRDRLAVAAHGLVDGRGVWRVVGAWESALTASAPRAGGPTVEMRSATLDDARKLWEWRNDPVTRAVSRHQGVVDFEDHLRWLRSSLAREDRRVLVGSVKGADVGTVRWDRGAANEWDVSITVAGEARGRGTAAPLLAAGERWLSANTRVTAFLAVVHRSNTPSRRLFVTGGYVPDLPADDEGFERWVRTVR